MGLCVVTSRSSCRIPASSTQQALTSSTIDDGHLESWLQLEDLVHPALCLQRAGTTHQRLPSLEPWIPIVSGQSSQQVPRAGPCKRFPSGVDDICCSCTIFLLYSHLDSTHRRAHLCPSYVAATVLICHPPSHQLLLLTLCVMSLLLFGCQAHVQLHLVILPNTHMASALSFLCTPYSDLFHGEPTGFSSPRTQDCPCS